MASTVWTREVAEAYDATSAAMYAAETLNPTVDLLAQLASGGPVLEMAIGTGRVALPLSAHGLRVHGIELSPHMVEQLRAKPGAEDIQVTVGDMTSAMVPGEFMLVYLVWNGLMNLTTQAEQVAVFRNAAAHLRPGGRFLVETVVPQVRRVPASETGRVFIREPGHVGIETFDDTVGQIAWSHHWMAVDGQLVHHAAPYRYVWPSETDLMAELAGLELQNRWSDWQQSRFSSDSENHVAVYERAH